MTERDIIRRLQEKPVPPPPEDLAARIINDIPDEIEIHPDLEHPEPSRKFIHHRPVWLAAAAAAAVALTAAVTWELRHERPAPEVISQYRVEEAIDPEPRLESPSVDEDRVDAATDAGDAVESKKNDNIWSRLGVEGDSVAETDTREKNAERSSRVGKDVDSLRQVPARDASEEESVLTDVQPTETKAQSLGEEGAAGRTRPGNKPTLRVPIPDPTPDEPAPVEAAIAGKLEQPVEKRLPRSKALTVLSPSGASTNETSSQREFAAKTRGDLNQESSASPPSTGGIAEPNDKPYGDVFFEHSGVNPFVDSEDDRLSTFGLDVDTGSYTVARRYLRDGNLPPREAIRVEEFVNSFGYGDEAPRREDFRLIAEGAPSAFMRGERYYTLRLAVKAREVDAADRPSAVLVFCVDVSGSMARENRLELVKKALYELLASLRRDDYVGLVIYGSTGEVLLRPTTNHDEIRSAIGRLRSGGSTNAEEGLSLAYDLLDDGENDDRIRRVILCSDGVANVGRTGPDSILERIRNETGEGIELTTVGFGMGNYNDVLMEQLADAGDGRYAYVDDLTEARRIFVEELTGTLFTLGREAKAQVEFDPAVVSRWRLLGYENRDIADERFRDPTVDAGEIGAGHTVTAVYEVKLQEDVSRSDTVATLRFRYRPVGRDDAVEMEKGLRVGDLAKSWEKATPALKLASLVAEFAELLKGTYWAKDGDLGEVLTGLQRLQADSAGDARVAELTGLVARANALQQETDASR